MVSKYKSFIRKFKDFVKRDVKLSRYCTLRVGGQADLFMDVDYPELLVDAIKLANQLHIPYFVLGGGSNIFFTESGFRGLVLHYIADNIQIDKKRQLVIVDAGCKLNHLIVELAKNNLGGLNFLANIPGSIGGAVVGNAGCYGREIGDCLVSVDVFNVKTGRLIKIKSVDLKFSYRHSKLKANPHLIVLRAKFRLVKDKQVNILRAIQKEKELRLLKHPQAPSAGSFFKNPESIAAWRLIDKSRMRGVAVGGARVSYKHSNFIINYRQATALDILKLADKIKRAVKIKTGVKLESEVRFVAQRDLIDDY